MVLSMTGFGRASELIDGREITVEIKSVNHRYFEYSSRIPRAYGYLDDPMKKALSAAISRGKIELALTIQNAGAQDVTVSVNKDMARGYITALREVAGEFNIADDITINSLTRFGDLFSIGKAAGEEEAAQTAALAVLQKAISSFVDMRAVEGAALKQDILGRLAFLEEAVRKAEENSAARVSAYTERLYRKLQALLEDRQIDDARILQEGAIYADKTAVDEEMVRLRGHIAQYREILNSDSPVGKKLDFLTQELNREVNTIGSKAGDIQITRLVVDMKSEIEKIREQIQNIE